MTTVDLGRQLYVGEVTSHANATRRAANNATQQLAEIQQALDANRPPSPDLARRLAADVTELVQHNAAWHALAECLSLTQTPKED